MKCDAAGAQAQRADRQRHQPGRDDRGQPDDRHRGGAGDLDRPGHQRLVILRRRGEDPGRVAADPEEGRMAEGDEPAIAEREVEPDPGQAEDRGRVASVTAKGSPETVPDERHEEEAASTARLSEGFARHQAVPIRPAGPPDEDRRHQDVDEHRGERRADGVGAGRVHDSRAKAIGSRKRPRVSVTPTRIAPTSAPLIEPMPPITTTTKAMISTGSPMPTCTDWIGPISAPARPASAAPRRRRGCRAWRCRCRGRRSSRGRPRRRGSARRGGCG